MTYGGKLNTSLDEKIVYQDFSHEFEYLPERQCNYNGRLDQVTLTREARVHYDRWCHFFDLPSIPDGLSLQGFIASVLQLLARSIAYKKWLLDQERGDELSDKTYASPVVLPPISPVIHTGRNTAQILQFKPRNPDPENLK